MAKKVIETEEVNIDILKKKLDTYIKQRDTIETMIDKYVELYQKLCGAIEATTDIISDLENKESEDTDIKTK